MKYSYMSPDEILKKGDPFEKVKPAGSGLTHRGPVVTAATLAEIGFDADFTSTFDAKIKKDLVSMATAVIGPGGFPAGAASTLRGAGITPQQSAAMSQTASTPCGMVGDLLYWEAQRERNRAMRALMDSTQAMGAARAARYDPRSLIFDRVSGVATSALGDYDSDDLTAVYEQGAREERARILAQLQVLKPNRVWFDEQRGAMGMWERMVAALGE